MEQLRIKKHWFKTWWGIALLGFCCLLFAAALAFAALVYNYYRVIKSGQGEALKAKMNQQYAQKTIEDPKITAARKELETADDPYLGSVNAPLTIVEFLDFKCPICKAEAPVLQQLAGKYGYKVKIIFRDFPMESVHPGAKQLAEIASCANEQGGYWPVSDYFFFNQDSISSTISQVDIDAFSDRLGLNKQKIRDCLSAGRALTEVNRDYADAYKNGVSRGTPTFFVNGIKLEGFVPLDGWEKLIKDSGV